MIDTNNTTATQFSANTFSTICGKIARMIMISDSMMATGMEDGNYSLGGLPVTVRGNLATLKDGTIAGSATNLMDCVRTVVKKMEIPFETAVRYATYNPAKAIGGDYFFKNVLRYSQYC